MKTISGSVTSSKPVSLKKAASVLHDFLSLNHGASEAVSAFLKRSSSSFDELVQFHKDLKSSKSANSGKKPKNLNLENGNVMGIGEKVREENGKVDKGKSSDFDEEQNLQRLENGGGDSERSEKKKKKKKKKESSESKEETEEKEVSEVEEVKVEKSKERKKRKKVDDGSKGLDDSEEQHIRKKKKRRHEEEH